jgi:hypothetical protein
MSSICYHVFSRCLTRLMEQSSVTIETFDAIASRGSMSTSSIYTLIKHFFCNSTTRARLCMAWVILASTYALLFQTLVSAMTGYAGEFTRSDLPKG